MPELLARPALLAPISPDFLSGRFFLFVDSRFDPIILLWQKRSENSGRETTLSSRSVFMKIKKSDQAEARQDSPERKKLLNQELARYLRLLTEHGNPEKVILFGTLAKGRVHEWSDIDLVVVEQSHLPFFQRLREIRKLLQPKVGIDIMVYTPDEFDQLCSERPFFKEEIVAKGKIVYEHHSIKR